VIVVLSNVNLDALEDLLSPLEPRFAGYNQYLSLLIDERSFLYDPKCAEVLIFIDPGEFFRDLLGVPPTDEEISGIRSRWNDLLEAVRLFRSRKSATVYLANPVFPPFSPRTYLESNQQPSSTMIQGMLDQDLAGLCESQSGVFVLDWRRVVTLYGYQALYDDKFWYLGRIRLRSIGFDLLSRELHNLRRAVQGKTAKVLVLDLDNTLWGGVIGEDGLGGIQLGEDGLGRCYRDFQRAILGLKNCGVLLAVCSKNNEADARSVFDQHGMSLLHWDDFTSRKINWAPKPENIAQIARDLDLGLDSFVFIDDNPVERSLVRETLPKVIVPEFPEDPAQLLFWFHEEVAYPWFGKVRMTGEDRAKNEQYQARAQRSELAATIDFTTFLKQLEARLTVRVDPGQYLPRLSQLTQKTNQFNLTTRRYNELEMSEFLSDEAYRAYSIEYEDKFGKEGVVGCAVVKLDSPAVLDTFLLSCRVVGKQVEYQLLRSICDDLAANGHQVLVIEFLPTERNVPAADFYKTISEAGMRIDDILRILPIPIHQTEFYYE
jgi:FkbH-like protein